MVRSVMFEMGTNNKKLFCSCLFLEMVDSQRQQAEERALKMKSMLVKTKKELADAKKQVRELSSLELFSFLCSPRQ